MATLTRAARGKRLDTFTAASRLTTAAPFPALLSSTCTKRRLAARTERDGCDGWGWRRLAPRVREATRLDAVSEGLPVYEVAAGLGSRLSLVYLGTLVTMLLGAAYVVVRQVLVRVEMDEAVKRLGDSIRAGNATSEIYYELAAVLIRKKLYIQAIKNLEKSINLWEEEDVEVAQVYNALGYCYFCLEKNDQAITAYKKAVDLRPNYVSAWNNLGDAQERAQQWKEAYEAYKQSLVYDAENKVAVERADYLKKKCERLGIPA